MQSTRLHWRVQARGYYRRDTRGTSSAPSEHSRPQVGHFPGPPSRHTPLLLDSLCKQTYPSPHRPCQKVHTRCAIIASDSASDTAC